MGMGFSNAGDFRRIIGWELDQITVDKYHIMFWFVYGQKRCLLNVADKITHKSCENNLLSEYEIYGDRKEFSFHRLLRCTILDTSIIENDTMDIIFSNSDILTIYDNPKFRSWWFIQYDSDGVTKEWSIEDDDPA